MKKKKNRTFLYFLFTFLSIIGAILPLFVYVLYKKDLFFVEVNGTKTTFAFVIMCIYAIVLIKKVFKEIDYKLTFFINLGFIAAILFFLSDIITQALPITLCVAIGFGIFCILDYFAKLNKDIQKEKVRYKANKEAQYEEELKEVIENGKV